MNNIKLIILIFLFMVTIPVYAGETATAHSDSTMSVKEMTQARLVGKTYRSQYGGSELIIKFKDNGRVDGRNGPWSSSGKYTIKEDGTFCINWDNPQWNDFCRLFSTFYVDTQ